jgi:1,4-dihydroxy-2-naphthoyl-CoA hydrolase
VNEPSTIGGDGPAAAMGLTYEEIGPELVRATVPVSDAIRQPQGLVHGGVHPLIAESITSHATLQAVADDGKIAMAQSNSATFLRPITAGTIHATGRRRHAGRGTWIWDVEIADDEERLCAMVRMTIAVRPRPPVYTADP